jgi:amino acid adenylation domain-containing protein
MRIHYVSGLIASEPHPILPPVPAWPADSNVIALFEQQAARTPDRPALADGAARLTYAELNRAANQTAHALLEIAGDQPQPVVLMMEQGVGMVTALIGALKAGKFYAPLPPHQPDPRLAAILNDMPGAAIVTSAGHIDRARGFAAPGTPVLAVEEIAAYPSENPGVPIHPDDLFNLMYTSGSTGKPKGVIQNHRNVLHAIQPRSRMTIRSLDRVGLLMSLAFGASVTNVFATLACGGLLLPFDVKRAGFTALRRWLIEERITVYHSVPSVFRRLAAMLDADEILPDMRVIKLGGEPVLKRDIDLFKQHFSDDCILRVALGTTETYIATAFMIDKTTPINDAVMPVGYPDLDAEILLLDDAGLPIPVGAVGAIAIRSRYLSPGYWRAPELTAAAYHAEPHDPTLRTYLTGDLGRFRPDGMLEHLGRIDGQVKIAGQRVEVAEIEEALIESEGVREAAVVAHAVAQGENRLAAYIVPDSVAPPAHTLRQRLAARLPDYMIPAAFVELESLPLLPFGKVDRSALVPPAWTRPDLPEPYVAPRTPVEIAVARIWHEVLGLERVGIYDRFLDLGGNSLQAAQIAARVQSEFSTGPTYSILLSSPSVAEMALAIVEQRAGELDAALFERLIDELEELPARSSQDAMPPNPLEAANL